MTQEGECSVILNCTADCNKTGTDSAKPQLDQGFLHEIRFIAVVCSNSLLQHLPYPRWKWYNYGPQRINVMTALLWYLGTGVGIHALLALMSE